MQSGIVFSPLFFTQQVFSFICLCLSSYSLFLSFVFSTVQFGSHVASLDVMPRAVRSQIHLWKKGDFQTLSALSVITTFLSIGKPQISVFFLFASIKSSHGVLSGPLSLWKEILPWLVPTEDTTWELWLQWQYTRYHCTCYLSCVARTVPALSICWDAGAVYGYRGNTNHCYWYGFPAVCLFCLTPVVESADGRVERGD